MYNRQLLTEYITESKKLVSHAVLLVLEQSLLQIRLENIDLDSTSCF